MRYRLPIHVGQIYRFRRECRMDVIRRKRVLLTVSDRLELIRENWRQQAGGERRHLVLIERRMRMQSAHHFRL